jgi:hypothetical protein
MEAGTFKFTWVDDDGSVYTEEKRLRSTKASLPACREGGPIRMSGGIDLRNTSEDFSMAIARRGDPERLGFRRRPVDDKLVIDGEIEMIDENRGAGGASARRSHFRLALPHQGNRALEADTFQNPGMLAVEDGAQIWNRGRHRGQVLRFLPRRRC